MHAVYRKLRVTAHNSLLLLFIRCVCLSCIKFEMLPEFNVFSMKSKTLMLFIHKLLHAVDVCFNCVVYSLYTQTLMAYTTLFITIIAFTGAL